MRPRVQPGVGAHATATAVYPAVRARRSGGARAAVLTRSGGARAAAWTTACAAVIALLVLAGCRDGVRPFDPAGRPAPDSASWQLTFNPGDDRAPAWSPDGDSIYYSAEGFPGVPGTPGVLLRIPRDRGDAVPVFPALQADSIARPWWTAPAVSPTGGRLAFVEIGPLWGKSICNGVDFCMYTRPRAETLATPNRVLLRRMTVRVRELGSFRPPSQDPADTVELPGVRFDPDIVLDGAPGGYVVEGFPFQLRFDTLRSPLFHPSWSSDGQRLVFSDGLRLLVWTPGSGAPTPIPGTQDGVWPAWRPGTDVVAFTRLVREDSVQLRCYTQTSAGRACNQLRIDHDIARGELTTVHVDGSGATVLGVGEEPSWSSDGGTLYFSRPDGIYRSAPDGSGAALVPGTDGGREPAPSPDGRFLAFTRPDAWGNFDVWIRSLVPAPD